MVEAGTLSLVYTDGPEIKAQNIKPGWSTTKEVSVKKEEPKDSKNSVNKNINTNKNSSKNKKK